MNRANPLPCELVHGLACPCMPHVQPGSPVPVVHHALHEMHMDHLKQSHGKHEMRGVLHAASHAPRPGLARYCRAWSTPGFFGTWTLHFGPNRDIFSTVPCDGALPCHSSNNLVQSLILMFETLICSYEFYSMLSHL